MPDRTIDTILDRWRAEMASGDAGRKRAAGDAFERLCVAFLRHDPVQRGRFVRVWRYADWARERPAGEIPDIDLRDRGVDLVAETADGDGFAAIQCKCHAEGARIGKGEIDSFLAASGTRYFSRRILIDTTGRDWTDNVEAELRSQAIPVTRLGLHSLRDSPIDWSRFTAGEGGEVPVAGPPVLRPHQAEAVDRIAAGLAGEGSRGKAIMACGTGKTLTALRAAERLAGKGGRVLYLVPSLALMSQTVRAWANDATVPLRAYAVCSDSQVGRRRRTADDSVDMDVLDLEWPATTDAAALAGRAGAEAPDAMTVVFATYQSSPVLEAAQGAHGLPGFDLAVCDEAHRTAGAIISGEEPSHFTRIHENGRIRASRRLYMTATPKVYAESARTRAGELAAALCSMDDVRLYGPVLYELGFAAAVERDLLADYRVIVLTVSENVAARVLAQYPTDPAEGLKLDDTALMIGCWRALAKADADAFPAGERMPMRRAIAFCRTIEASRRVERRLQDLAGAYRSMDGSGNGGDPLPDHGTPVRHVDGTFSASRRGEALAWLDSPDEGECRVLTNARCLTEGVDLPALDGILFMHPRRSQIEVVQAVGRVMRRAEGKRMGYIVLPVVVAPGASAEELLGDSDRWRKVWQTLNAIRSHDEGFDAELNRIEMGDRPKRLSIITLSGWTPPSADAPGPIIDGKGATDPDSGGNGGSRHVPPEPQEPPARKGLFDELPSAIMARIVERCGSRKYWDEWAGDVARIAQAHVRRIAALVTAGDADDPDARARAEIFDDFVRELRDDLNPGVSREDAVEMLAQHLVTGPVFDALFGEERFTARNPVSRAMQTVLDVIRPAGVGAEAGDLGEFYDSVRRRVRGAGTDDARQRIVAELYDKFFRNAFRETSERLGIVYTPVEIVDFVLRSVADVLGDEFGTGFGDRGVHVLDPFTGTGTFLTRLLQSGLVDAADLGRKYESELHANEIVLLAYYIASVNVEAAFHAISGGGYRPFGRICLTDTFQMGESDDFMAELLADNSSRREEQRKRDITVIVGNPPWQAGKKEPGYPKLYRRIKTTYAKRSTATNRNSLYDSYKLAIRWASDRIGERGAVGFVTNGSWLDGNVDSGIRACLAEEFTSVHVVNLRGNARTSGDLRRAEGGNVFGEGSRAPVAIAILVRNPVRKGGGCRILYRDVGDRLTAEGKLSRLVGWGSVAGVDGWREIEPDERHDWINRREAGFGDLVPLGSKEAKAGRADDAVFRLFSNGYYTGKDSYLYNFSRDVCLENARRMVEDYRAALAEIGDQPSEAQAKAAAKRHSGNTHWDATLINSLKQRKSLTFSKERLRSTIYRPFVRMNCFAEDRLAKRPGPRKVMFPAADTDNRAICVPGIGSTKPFSALMVDAMPDLHFMSFGQCFPRYRFEVAGPPRDGDLFGDGSAGLRRVDNIPDTALGMFRARYRDPDIGGDDVFDYVYGVLHAPDFREAFPNALARGLARIPLARDFHAFARAGRELGDLHVGYETCPEHPLEPAFSGESPPGPDGFRPGPGGMRFRRDGGATDRSVLIVNDRVSLTGIPDAAHAYSVNGRTPLEWLIDRYRVTTDRKSGITNDANAWFDGPEDLISAIRRIVHLSVETARIVGELPESLGGSAE